MLHSLGCLPNDSWRSFLDHLHCHQSNICHCQPMALLSCCCCCCCCIMVWLFYSLLQIVHCMEYLLQQHCLLCPYAHLKRGCYGIPNNVNALALFERIAHKITQSHNASIGILSCMITKLFDLRTMRNIFTTTTHFNSCINPKEWSLKWQ